jgi:lactate permease
VPVAVVAPILIGLDFAPMAAIIIPSIGSGWAVTFGSLGSSFQALLATTGLTSNELAFSAATFLGIAALVTGLMVMHVLEGWRGVLRLAIPAIILGAVMGAVQLLVADKGPWNTAAFVGSMAGLLVSFGLARFYRGNRDGNGKLDGKRLAIALSGYAILIIVTLGVQLIPGVKQALSGIVLKVNVPELTTSLGYVTPAGTTKPLTLLRHAGFLLLYASILAYLLYWATGSYQKGSIKNILIGTVKRVKAPTISITLMVCMAIIMELSGMTNALAQGLAQFTGSFFPAIAAWIGAIGAFMTGSNTNSNVVFSLLQLRTATLLGYTVSIILAGQTAGAALASVAAPAKVVVGTSTADLAGREGEVMRKMMPYTIILVLLISILTALGILFKF